ncbi:hypothetical protein [Microbacterium arborescens]
MPRTGSGHRNVAVLVGNGLSIAFNQNLLLPNITKQVRKRIMNSGDGGKKVVRAMRSLADATLPAGQNSHHDFERLVGAFGAESSTLKHLQALARVSHPDDHDLRKAIRKTTAFARELRDLGTGHVLEVVYENSRSSYTESEPLNELLRAIYRAFPGTISFGNLNYDTILLAALMAVDTRGFADLGHGWKRCRLGDGKIAASQLRDTASDFPTLTQYPVQLLHLHGSLTYWATQDGSQLGKLDRSDVQAHRLFKKLREGKTDLRPLVVLNRERQKIEDVEDQPFKLAYEMFERGLVRSDHWLIIGYSFRDVAVNDLLRREFIGREQKPKVLVVTQGKSPSREEITAALGWGAEDGESESWLRRNERGAYGMEQQKTWRWFSG